MRHLFVCCDGTWNTPTDVADGVPVPTNVYKFHVALAKQNQAGDAQLSYYHPGVGTEGSKLKKVFAGAVGSGLDANIKSAYKWLSDTYTPGDKIYLIGFSRGAYTARSLGGFLSQCGLCKPNSSWGDIDQAFALYRTKVPVGDKNTEAKLKADRAAFRKDRSSDPNLTIHFIGVWDTVGALGVPRNLDWLKLDDWENHRFHDTSLSPVIQNAFHAVAIDEKRASFAPTLWEGPFAPHQTVEQAWFPGVHADVGGGYKETGLSDGALSWMIEKAETSGACFEPGIRSQIRPDARGVLHDSFQGVFKLFECQPRSMPEVAAGNAAVHPLAIDRQSNPPITQAPYRVSQRLQPGQSLTVTIYANDMWNATNLYMEKGETYVFATSGEWVNDRAKSGPEGIEGGLFDRLFRFKKRYKDAKWFALIGSIGDAGNPDVSGAPAPMTTFKIGEQLNYTVPTRGYLYCFANDARESYANNHGSLTLTVRRV